MSWEYRPYFSRCHGAPKLRVTTPESRGGVRINSYVPFEVQNRPLNFQKVDLSSHPWTELLKQICSKPDSYFCNHFLIRLERAEQTPLEPAETSFVRHGWSLTYNSLNSCQFDHSDWSRDAQNVSQNQPNFKEIFRNFANFTKSCLYRTASSRFGVFSWLWCVESSGIRALWSVWLPIGSL